MITTRSKFTPSINIIRDGNKNLSYISTPNSELVFQQLEADYALGIHSFNIIGSYGTGKSSFLWALEKQLNGERLFFKSSHLSVDNGRKYKFLKIIGDYQTLFKSFAAAVSVAEDSVKILDELQRYYVKCEQQDLGLVVLIDEFGKFLEYAARNNPERELYFIQQVAEFANDTDKDILFITTLHQNFDAYTSGLNRSQRLEWEKVKGRFKEIAFNEPVEQLLVLAAAYFEREITGKIDETPKELLNIIQESRTFPFNRSLMHELAFRLYPLDILSASILTLALQKYGQNERSLFTFLEAPNEVGIKNFDRTKAPFYHIGCVYDYLAHNFYSFLSTKFNPDYLQWRAIRSALERAEPFFKENYPDAAKLIKTIGLLNISASKAARIDETFLTAYANICLGVKDPLQLIHVLKTKKIIRFQEYKRCFVLFEGTDIDIEWEIKRAETAVDLPVDITPKLQQYFHFPYLMAKAAYFKVGTPRFFAFRLSTASIHDAPEGEVDGIINLIFDDQLTTDSVVAASTDCREAILFGLHRRTLDIRGVLLEIEKVKHVLALHMDDPVVRKELKALHIHLINELNQKIMNDLYQSEDFTWILKGKIQTIENRRDFNALLSIICENVYSYTPRFPNELINRHKLSSPISQAKKLFFQRLVNHWHERDSGFPEDRFPPEKTIYLSLLKETGLHRELECAMTLSEPTEPTFQPLWNACEEYLASARKSKKCLAHLVGTLRQRPFKLKEGFLEFWIPIYLFIKRDDYALYFNDIYVPDLNVEILQSLTKRPEKYTIKAFDIDGIKIDLFNKYRMMVQRDQQNRLTQTGFIDTIKPFLLFYSRLPEYTRKTRRLSPTAAAIREAIAAARDPEKTFFEDLPLALGYSMTSLNESDQNLEEFVEKLQKGIRELRNCFDELCDRLEETLLRELGLQQLKFEAYKMAIAERYKSLREHLLLPHQQSFYARLHSHTDERKVWLKSIIHSVLGRPAEQINDQDEFMIHDKLRDMIYELDNLCEFEKSHIDPQKEEIVKLEMVSSEEGLHRKTLRFPKERMKEAVKIKESVKSKLTGDKKTNIIALLSLLKDEMNDE
jgi:hypothetical protein